jgi:hypothetical protein
VRRKNGRNYSFKPTRRRKILLRVVAEACPTHILLEESGDEHIVPQNVRSQRGGNSQLTFTSDSTQNPASPWQ